MKVFYCSELDEITIFKMAGFSIYDHAWHELPCGRIGFVDAFEDSLIVSDQHNVMIQYRYEYIGDL